MEGRAEGRGRLSRSAVAKVLGVSEAMVRALEKQGRLKSERVDGRACYDVGEVEQLAKTYKPDPGRARRRPRPRPEEIEHAPVATRCLELLKQGQSVADVAIATKAHPLFVKRLYEEFIPEGIAARRAAELQREMDRERREQLRWDRRIELAKVRERRSR